MRFNNGNLKIKLNHAYKQVRTTGTECFTQQMKSAFITAIIIFSKWRCLLTGELERGGGRAEAVQSSPPLLQAGVPGNAQGLGLWGARSLTYRSVHSRARTCRLHSRLGRRMDNCKLSEPGKDDELSPRMRTEFSG